MGDSPAPEQQQRDDSVATDRLRGTVYTAVSHGYDKQPSLGDKEPDVVRELRVSGKTGEEAVLWNRENKIMLPPQTGLWSVYLDGSLSPKGPLREHVEDWLDRHEVAMFRHPHRTCAYAEIDACVARKKLTAEQGEKARSTLQLEGFPRDFGLWACGMIARRVHLNALQIFVATMWWHFTRECPRDQIWLPYVLWKIRHSTKRIRTIDADIFDNKIFKFRRHGT
jgi:hypothetical protein